MLWARRRLRRAAHLLHGSSLRDVAGFGSLSGQLCVARSTCDQQASGTGRAVPMDGLSAVQAGRCRDRTMELQKRRTQNIRFKNLSVLTGNPFSLNSLNSRAAVLAPLHT